MTQIEQSLGERKKAERKTIFKERRKIGRKIFKKIKKDEGKKLYTVRTIV